MKEREYTMKKWLWIAGGCLSLLTLAGCEWTSGGGAETWDSTPAANAQYLAVDGNYVPFNPNGFVVSTFDQDNSGVTTNISQTITNTTISTNTVSGEILGTGNGGNTAFSGTLAFSPMPGTLLITAESYRFTDTYAASAPHGETALTATNGASGTLNYDTRTWSLNFPAPLSAGAPITASYQYESSETVVTGGEVVVTSTQGNHGNPIYQMTVFQRSNLIEIRDNNGSVYEGSLGEAESSASSSSATNVVSSASIAPFSATGMSQGYRVTMTGIMKGSTITGTYIEEGGYTAKIDAVRQ